MSGPTQPYLTAYSKALVGIDDQRLKSGRLSDIICNELSDSTMQIYRGFNEARAAIPPCVLVIGNFDGVHLGHLSLIKRAQELASTELAVGLYTFWPHPQSVLRPERAPRLLCTREQKIDLLKNLGIELLVEEPFTLEYASLSAERFASDVIGHAIRPRAVITGENFHFGNRALGTPEEMGEWLTALGITYEKMPSLFVDGVLCSSSKIRELIGEGAVTKASRLLGRKYSISGEVVKGAGRGRTIGIPTANVKTASALIPASGVYVTEVKIGSDDRLYRAATNIGTRPTFNGESTTHIESHILDFDGDLYGVSVEIFFVQRIRDEKKFTNAEALVQQIQKDIEVAKKNL